MRKLFVGSLDISVTEDDLKEYFGDFGEIEDTTIHRYKNINYHWYINSILLLIYGIRSSNKEDFVQALTH